MGRKDLNKQTNQVKEVKLYSVRQVKHSLNSFLENEGSFPVMNIFLFYL